MRLWDGGRPLLRRTDCCMNTQHGGQGQLADRRRLFLLRILLLLSFFIRNTSAYVPRAQIFPLSSKKQALTFHEHRSRSSINSALSRRALLPLIPLILSPKPAISSGGATAGGAYLIRAKSRYSERVKRGATSFFELRHAVENGALLKDPFLQGGKDSAFEDFTSASYLLANAWRSNSTTPPDSLPTVKKFKFFMKCWEDVKKESKNKKTEAALSSYDAAVDALKIFMASVEL